MKKTILWTLFCFVSVAAISQGVTFKPKWKKGEKYQLEIKSSDVRWNGEEILSAHKKNVKPILDITDVAKTIIVTVSYEDVLQGELDQDYYAAGLSPVKVPMSLVYSIDKKTGAYSLTNGAQSSKDVTNAIIKAGYDLRIKLDEVKMGIAKKKLDRFQTLFESQAVLEAYFGNYLEMMLIPFFREYTVGKAVQVNGETANPFDPSKRVKVSRSLVLKNQDQLSYKAYFEENATMDLTNYIPSLKPMVEESIKESAEADTSMTQADLAAKLSAVDGMLQEATSESKKKVNVEFDSKDTMPIKINMTSEAKVMVSTLKTLRSESSADIVIKKIPQ